MRSKVLLLLVFFGITSSYQSDHPGDELEPVGNRGRSRALSRQFFSWSFCTPRKPCSAGQGDCDRDSDCQSGLKCGRDNCKDFDSKASSYADCCVAESVIVHAACNNEMTVYANGEVLIEPDSSVDSWTRSFTAVLPSLPPENRVLGIACQDKNFERGIVAELDIGGFVKVLTNDSWLCSSEFVKDWNMPGFVDKNSVFSPAKRGNAYMNRWVPDPIDEAAESIWSSDQSPGSWAYCKQSFPGPTLHAACDNHMTVYVDGSVLIEPVYDLYSWRTPNTATIPFGTKVIGIECKDKSFDYGIVASLSNGVVTDENWLCSSKLVTGWNLPGFVDKNADFLPAKDGNSYRNEFRPSPIDKKAKVIWGPDQQEGTTAYCRLNVDTAISG